MQLLFLTILNVEEAQRVANMFYFSGLFFFSTIQITIFLFSTNMANDEIYYVN